MKASRPDAVPIAGGTDLMVAINFDALRPPAMLDVSSLPELREVRWTNGSLFGGRRHVRPDRPRAG
jgi:CO/xanthine dehydrogenase FAD-binding subunit